MPDRIICILGMHRSGTSCLTGSLEAAGLYLGDIHTWNPFNLKGNRENQDIVDLHDLILADNGGAWDSPPKRVAWSQERKNQAMELLSSYKDVPIIGFKDPRTILVLDGWKSVAGNMDFIGIFRHPDAVAQSLMRRSKIPRKQALDLWYRYNRILYKEYLSAPFPILCFDDTEQNFQAKLAQTIRGLGLTEPESGESFYDSELKIFSTDTSTPLPWKVRRLYKQLTKVCA
ncbi:MAG: hypothetical protein ABJK25_08845 [Halieaceae bacterium]